MASQAQLVDPSAKGAASSASVRELNGTRYPNLKRDVEAAGTLRLRSGYEFRLFSFGERGSSISPAVIKEIRAGLSEAAEEFVGRCDSVVTVQPGGSTWGPVLAPDLNLPLKVVTIYKSSPNGQTQARQHHGYARRRLYFPEFFDGERVILLDDVVSSGSTVRTVVQTLRRECGVEVVLVLCIATMTHDAASISRDLHVPIRYLVSAADC